MTKERGIHYLQPASPDITFSTVPSPDQELVHRFASGLDETITIYHAAQDDWVRSMGGKSYSEIAAITQYMFSSFIGATSPEEIKRLARSPLARISHLVWRIVAAIDDAVDAPKNETVDASKIVDTDGVPVTRLMQELIHLPGVTPVTSYILSKITGHTQTHESEEAISFKKAFRAKQSTTGALTAISAALAYGQLLVLFPKKTRKKSLKEFIRQSYTGSLVAQFIDDIVDLPNDIHNPTASSLVLAMARDVGEKEKLVTLLTDTGQISIASIIENGMQTGTQLSEEYQKLRMQLGKAPEDMKHYFDNQFYFLKATV